MADDAGFRRSVIFVLILALLVASLDVARILTFGNPKPAHPTAAPPSPPVAPTPSTVGEAPTTTNPAPPPAPGRSTGATAGGGATVAAPDPLPAPAEPTTTTTTTPPAPVKCTSELALADSPDAPYNFLCVREGTPLTWPSDNIRLFSSGLTPDQSSALQAALPQWEAQGRFSVTVVDSSTDADVTVGPGALENAEDGHALVHYVCLATCAFDHVDIELSATRALTKGLWVTTILHELGHAAGLNHVSRKAQVMYCNLDLTSPVAYADGDLAGLQELARIRAA